MAQEISEIDRQRAANIAEKEALMKKLELAMNTQPSTPFKRTPAPKTSSSSKKTTPVKPVKEETPVPRRTSARLAGITADSDVAKRKAEQDDEVAKAAWEAKRRRVSGDLNLGDIMVSGQKAELSGLLGNKYETTRYERTFGDDDVNQTTDKDLKSLREKMSGLILWDKWEPNRIKITPERVYCMAFHPSEDKPLVFSGDKMGNLGILDASQPRPKPEKDGDEEEDDPDPAITTLKPHTRTISGMHFHYASPSKLYMASYDSSIRALDLEKSIATEVYAPPSTMDDEPISSVDMAPEDNQTMYFTTLNGAFGYHDMRTGKESPATIYQLSDKKIGGFSLYPTAPHYFATASLDRTMKLWDLRQLSSTDPVPVGEHESSLSVSHAAFSSQGHVVTSSYDNSLKIYNFGAKGLNTWGPQHNLGEDQMNPDAVVRHNCQTGRWVTILRPQWQACPSSGIERFCIGNMNRFVDIYAASGDQLAQLGGDHITAVPAVAVFHPTQDWVVGGTASGKACLWM